MGYAVINDYIDRSLYPLKAPYSMKPEYITIHNTANDASATSEIAYMKRNPKETSYHVAVDDKHAIQAIPFDRNAFHAGDGKNGTGNRKSIGIEICFSRSGGERYRLAEANTIDYVAQLLKKYGWGMDRVKFHRDWSGKNCPHRIINEGRENAFRNAIARRLKELNNPTVKTAQKEEVKVEQYKKDASPSKSLADKFNKAVELKITDGTYPQRPATREEVAVMIVRALENIK